MTQLCCAFCLLMHQSTNSHALEQHFVLRNNHDVQSINYMEKCIIYTFCIH